MLRHPMLDQARVPTTVKIRLGIKTSKDDREYPQEVDYFVLKAEDGATPEMIELYGAAPKQLRMMIHGEAPSAVPGIVHDPSVVDVANTAWSWSGGLLCKGYGGDRHDQPQRLAEATDKAFAERIAQVIGAHVEPAANRYEIPCWGRDCPKYRATVDVLVPQPGKAKPKRELRLAEGHDPDASCSLTMRFKALLLDPKVHALEEQPKVLGIAEIVSSSINTARDVLSSFDLIRTFTRSPGQPNGRTRFIPFLLIRKPTTTVKGGRRRHFTLAVQPEPDVWQRWSRIPPDLLTLSPGLFQELKALRSAEYDLDSFRDLIPRPAELALPAGADLLREDDKAEPAVPQGGTTAPEDAIGQAVEDRAPEDPELDRPLIEAERQALKDALADGVADSSRTDPADPESPTRPEVLDRLYGLIRAYDVEHDTSTRRLSDLTKRHEVWILAQLRPLPQPADPDEIPPEQGAGEAPDNLGATGPGPPPAPAAATQGELLR